MSISSLNQGLSLVWTTKVTGIDRREVSPVFILLNLKWKLVQQRYRDTFLNSTFFKIELMYCDNYTLRPPLRVITFLEQMNVKIFCSEVFLSSDYSTTLWSQNEKIIEKEMKYSFDSSISIILLITPLSQYGVSIIRKTLKDDKSTQVDDVCTTSTEFSGTSVNMEELSNDMCAVLNKRLMSDVILKCGDDTIQCHKVVLSGRSNVFSAMFKNTLVERKSEIVPVEDIESPVMHEFLKFLYSGKISLDLPFDMVSKLYVAGVKYAVSSLQQECSVLISRNLNDENFIQVLEIADAHTDQQLKEAVADFIIKRPELVKNEKWINLSEKLPKLANQIYQRYFEKAFSKKLKE